MTFSDTLRRINKRLQPPLHYVPAAMDDHDRKAMDTVLRMEDVMRSIPAMNVSGLRKTRDVLRDPAPGTDRWLARQLDLHLGTPFPLKGNG